MSNAGMIQAISECHSGLTALYSLDLLSDEYVEMIDKVFLPLLEGVRKNSELSSAVSDFERDALVSFFIDFSDKVRGEKRLSAPRRLALEHIVEKFERHVVSFMCALARGKDGISEASMNCPSYADAMKVILKNNSTVLKELAETKANGQREHVLLKKIAESFERENLLKEEIARKGEYFLSRSVPEKG